MAENSLMLNIPRFEILRDKKNVSVKRNNILFFYASFKVLLYQNSRERSSLELVRFELSLPRFLSQFSDVFRDVRQTFGSGVEHDWSNKAGRCCHRYRHIHLWDSNNLAAQPTMIHISKRDNCVKKLFSIKLEFLSWVLTSPF